MDHLKLWGEELRLSSGSSRSTDKDDIDINEIKQEEPDLVNEGEEDIEVDVTNEFSIDMVFNSRQSLIEWVQNTGRNLGFVIDTKSSEIGGFGRRYKLLLKCDRGGTYKSKKTSTRLTVTKKRDCPFRVKGMKLKTDDDWTVRVLCGMHNHSATLYMEGHSYVDKLFAAENEIFIDMLKNLVKPQNILYTLKNRDPNNVSTNKTIYNARQKFRTTEKTGSLALLRAFLHLLLMDATYKTNRFRMSLVEIVGVTSTKMTF
ncbi:uncharacterized protein LOC119983430 [Tripterygium wilfordii]|uniref:uncharacterized protein LOC119983430 n=1 Tax=Tripterygium wilfordii TaxID=458696 RepID=UPI0018F8472A|nr:uncharacterized protein LOC119983430 [Tripterygium wilfordii]